MTHQQDHDTPMHGGGGSTHQNEPGDASSHARAGRQQSGDSGVGSHGGAKHSGSRRLCIVVDDFGLHAGIGQAALQLVAMQRVHAIGCMVGAPAWRDWAPALRPLTADTLDVGLHLDLTEYPLMRQPRPLSRLIACSLLHTLDRASIQREIGAQLDAFERDLGRPPAFVDGHQHVHQLPIVRNAMLAELHQRYAPNLPWLRSTRCAPGATFKPRLIAALGASGLAVQARLRGFRQNRQLLGVYDFTGDDIRYLARVEAWLLACATGDLLMCHPSQTPQVTDPIGAARATEFRVLSGDTFGDLLLEQGIELTPMSSLLSQDASPPR
jgi:predicted glycoside hydrolase/deacetylase ChbG (UPF0249 family)